MSDDTGVDGETAGANHMGLGIYPGQFGCWGFLCIILTRARRVSYELEERILLGEVPMTKQRSYTSPDGQAVDALMDAQTSLRTVLEASPVSMFVIGPDRTLLFANSIAQNLFKSYPIGSARSCCGDLIACRNRHLDQSGCGHSCECSQCDLDNAILTALKGEEDSTCLRGESHFYSDNCPDVLWVKFAVTPLNIGEQRYALASVEDITERKLTEKALQTSERRFSELIRYSFDSITILDAEGVQIFVSDAVERILGYDPSALIGISVIKEMVHPDDQARVKTTFATILKEGMGGTQYRHKHKNGSWVYLEAWGTNQLENPDIRGVVVNVRDITERKLAECALSVSEEQFKSIVESSPMGMHFYRLDDNNRLILVAANPASDRLLNIEHSKLIGMSIEDAFPGLIETDIPEMYREVALGQIPIQTFETPYRDEHFSGVYEVYVFRTGDRTVATLYLDVSERKKVQELMIQTEKMMSVGGLAAGMAHEINNPLSGILQNVQVLMRRLTTELPENLRAAEDIGCSFDTIKSFMEKRDIISSLESVRSAGTRAARIVSSMLEFSRKSTSGHTPVDLNALLDKALELCSTDYDLKKKYDFRSIRIVRDYEPTLPLVSCFETQIQQVLMNLLTNAAQAMADTPSPSISLRTFTERDWACIEIEDNGPGMTEDVRKHVFEPFFTTKPVGEGTGLGLSVSYFIVVNHHHGTINVNSVLRKGTRFVVRLPITPNPATNVERVDRFEV